jgi:hypothetical protein
MISDERFHLYCKEVSKNDVKLLQSKKERGRGQILIDTVKSRAVQKINVGHDKHENVVVGLPFNRCKDYLI